MSQLTLNDALETLPLVAILRGVLPEEVVVIAEVIVAAGFRVVEVPLNSPEPYASIEALAVHFGGDVLVGAGTVVDVFEVDHVAAAGGRLIISPNVNAEVISYSKQKGLCSLPGFFTPSEAFDAIAAGADALKLFPADTVGAKELAAISVVLPSIPVLPVGGVNADSENMRGFIKAGATGFGLGSGLYRAGMSIDQVRNNAQAYVAAYREATA